MLGRRDVLVKRKQVPTENAGDVCDGKRDKASPKERVQVMHMEGGGGRGG